NTNRCAEGCDEKASATSVTPLLSQPSTSQMLLPVGVEPDVDDIAIDRNRDVATSSSNRDGLSRLIARPSLVGAAVEHTELRVLAIVRLTSLNVLARQRPAITVLRHDVSLLLES